MWATLAVSLLLVGTFVFRWVEGWSYLDSFYFSAISATTVGYGDFSPKTASPAEPPVAAEERLS